MNSQSLAAFFNRKANAFDAIYTGRKPRLFRLWDRLTRRNILQRMAFTLEVAEPWDNQRVLDVGCGSGRVGLEVALRGASEVVGLDIAGEMLALAQRNAEEAKLASICHFVQADLSTFRDDCGFDTVIAHGFFDYVVDPLAALLKMRELCRGGLVASFPTKRSLRAPFRRAWLKLHGCPIRFYAHWEIVRLCHLSGFKMITSRRQGPIELVAAEIDHSLSPNVRPC